MGLPGVGRSTLLGFLYYRPEVLAKYLTISPETVAIIPIDLNILPDDTIATMYRVILRAFYRTIANSQPDTELGQLISDLYQKYADAQDPFLTQSALLDVLASFQEHGMRVVWILNHFDEFLKVATPEMTRSLRSLRDNYKETLCYLMGMLTEMSYLPDLELGRTLYDILDIHVYWVGPLSEQDAENMLQQELRTAVPPPNTGEIRQLWQLIGGYPALIRAVAYHWTTGIRQLSSKEMIEAFLMQPDIQYRLSRLWDSLTQEEQFALSELHKMWLLQSATLTDNTLSSSDKKGKQLQLLKELHNDAMLSLHKKGICSRTKTGWRIFSILFTVYVGQVEGRSRGGIWENTHTSELFQGRTALTKLTPLERAVLRFFTHYPRIQHTYSTIFMEAWPDDVQYDPASNESIQQIIRGLRKKIEPNPSKPVYIITWRGQPEGGYQFFPEGRPVS